MKQQIRFYILTAFVLGAGFFGLTAFSSVSAICAGQTECVKNCDKIYNRCMVSAKSAPQKQACATQRTACYGRCQGN